MRDVESSPMFSPDVRQALTLAHEETTFLNHWLIGTEHLLLALLRQDGVVGDVVSAFGVTLEDVREAVLAVRRPLQHLGSSGVSYQPFSVKQPTRGGTLSVGEPGLTPRAAAAVDHAVREAQDMRMDVGPAHLMLGLLEIADGLGIGLLAARGVDPSQLETKVRALLAGSR
jgi:ATP-dependent Clp protease ATP-binding subunit ClpA